MGHTARPKLSSLYATLVHIYPQSFRSHYGTTMVQTFDDMLDSESTKVGRLKVWARTLTDLPLSAGKEYVTNGKEINMNKSIKLLLGAAVLAVIIVGAGSYWAGNLHARQSIGIERVTTSQLGDAMQQDNFFSSYGSAALLFKATASDIKNGSNVTLVTFATNRPFNVVCQFPSNLSVKTGQTISVIASGGSAERQKSGVLLHNCSLN
jgi:hypothetical protein